MGCMTTDENNSTRRDLQRQCAEADALAALDALLDETRKLLREMGTVLDLPAALCEGPRQQREDHGRHH